MPRSRRSGPPRSRAPDRARAARRPRRAALAYDRPVGNGTRTVVVGYDGSEPAGRALDRAAAEAGADGRVIVAAVAELPLDPEGPQTFGSLEPQAVDMIPPHEPPEVSELLQRAREQLAGTRVELAWDAGEPAAAIVGVARDRGADLIVLGESHHGLVGRLLGADTAAEVSRRAGCEVVAVP